MKEFLLGIDIGTTATKLVLIHKDGEIVGSISKSVILYSDKSGWAEEDPMQWWDNIRELFSQLVEKTQVEASQIAAVGVSGMVPTLIMLDKNGKPLRFSIQQSDARAYDEIQELNSKLTGYNVLDTTGSPISQQSIAPKVMWIKKNEPEIYNNTYSICGSYDFIARQLTGNSSCLEVNWALESGMYDYKAGVWDETILKAAGIDKAWLGEVHLSHQLVGNVQESDDSGIESGTAVVAGTADHVASAFSAGLVENGDLLIKLGGAGDILLTSSKAIVDERLFLDFHLVPGKYLPNGCMATSGSIVRWFQKEIADGMTLDELECSASKVDVGSDGLVLLPYFLGEKTPINDPKARGTFFGLHLGHTKGHLYRALLEGVGFGFNNHFEVFEELGAELNKVRITNGGSKCRLWRQIIADISGLTLESIVSHPGSSLGAAFIAGIGVGLIHDWEDINKFVEIEEVIVPNLENNKRYRKLYEVYKSLYTKLIDEHHILADLTKDNI